MADPPRWTNATVLKLLAHIAEQDRELAQRASLCDNDETGRGARGERQ